MLAKFTAFIKNQWRWIVLVLTTIIASAVLIYLVFVPAFTDPKNRTYTSKFGYAQVKRSLGQEFSVRTSKARMQFIEQRVLGEGLVTSRTILIPVIPTAEINEVLIKEGDYVQKGQTLALLDDSRLQMKIRSSELALKSAQAELKRVEAGSAYILSQERPEEDAINLELAQQQLELLRDKEVSLKELANTGSVSRFQLLELQREIIQVRSEVSKSTFKLKSAELGAGQSLIIAQNAVEEAAIALEHRYKELEDYTIVAPADGVINRQLIYPGEFNQDTGRPAFVLASDLWFESHFDQTSINHIKENDTALVYLEAYPGQPFNATIKTIIPVVTYNLGGPEINRPIRPRGTGAPEWPATFRARLEVEMVSGAQLVPGLTGFARIQDRKRVLAIPKKAVTSMSAGHGIVHVMNGEQRELRKVTTGISNHTYIEITSGLEAGETVITEGHTVLEPGDAIEIENGP